MNQVGSGGSGVLGDGQGGARSLGGPSRAGSNRGSVIKGETVRAGIKCGARVR